MVTMRKDSASFLVSKEEVDAYLERGFSIVREDNGGDASASPPDSLPDEEMDAVEIVEQKENPLMLNGRYWNQLNKEELRTLCAREGVAYAETDTVPKLRLKFGKYAKSVKYKR